MVEWVYMDIRMKGEKLIKETKDEQGKPAEEM